MTDFLFQAFVYLTAGIVIGPVIGLVGSETQDILHFAEFGVAMALFLVGLKLEPRALWSMRHKLLGLGGLQVGLTAGAIAAIAMLLTLLLVIGFDRVILPKLTEN